MAKGAGSKSVGSKWWFNPKAVGYDQGVRPTLVEIVSLVPEEEQQKTTTKTNQDGSPLYIPVRHYVVKQSVELKAGPDGNTGPALQLFANDESLSTPPAGMV